MNSNSDIYNDNNFFLISKLSATLNVSLVVQSSGSSYRHPAGVVRMDTRCRCADVGPDPVDAGERVLSVWMWPRMK